MQTWAGLITAMLALLLFTDITAGEGYHSKAERLEKLRAEIVGIRAELRGDQRREDSLTQQLQRLDEDIGGAAAGVHELAVAVQAQRRRIAKLRTRYERNSGRLTQQRTYLAREIVAAYALGRDQYLRLILNQEDPNRLERVQVYYEYFRQARGRRIQEAVQALQSMDSLEQKLQVELAQLEELKRQRIVRQKDLQRDRRQRAVLLRQLRRHMADQGQRLQRLQADAAELTKLVQRLRTLADIPAANTGERPFRVRKGQLAWPLTGKLAAHYGAERDVGVLWQGVFIAAAEGSAVHAVAGGRVVFADWLRGLGLLLIIDHGGGYMTLYGHNQSLYKGIGDWIEAGEIIAAVGVSGGVSHAGLYFEVRVRGKPENPLAWLRPVGQHG
ncbi:murein hydrolase activator EnvC family protein [Nitrococcus mobilis]|uniref:Peptidase, family M23/M37 domain protein n=1 Tax=Nitrococcus mobilis Nb-231 TaxID=314278 RepID=A4BTY4_9GAMM|nr:peptidoglycan DD-metalloendopeptidase family protein [Nitrococcus mobilis]EAR20805.1 peptidase, family M23/M37 domain protein [Nitrococcus mobilis Nb-231]